MKKIPKAYRFIFAFAATLAIVTFAASQPTTPFRFPEIWVDGDITVLGTVDGRDVSDDAALLPAADEKAALDGSRVTNPPNAGNTYATQADVAAGGGGDVSAVPTPANGEIAAWTSANTIEGLTEGEFKTAYSLEIGTHVAAEAHTHPTYLDEIAHDALPSDNPHGVTASQVGLGSVPNVDWTSPGPEQVDASRYASGSGGATNTVAGANGITNTGNNVNAVLAPTYGSAANTVCEGDDPRLSDARTPTAHTHAEADVTDLGSYPDSAGQPPTKVAQTDGAGGWTFIDTPTGGGSEVNDLSSVVTWTAIPINGTTGLGTAAQADTGNQDSGDVPALTGEGTLPITDTAGNVTTYYSDGINSTGANVQIVATDSSYESRMYVDSVEAKRLSNNAKAGIYSTATGPSVYLDDATNQSEYTVDAITTTAASFTIDGVNVTGLPATISTAQSTADDHIANASGAHAASAISYDPAGASIVATEVQAAIDELDGDITTNAGSISTNASAISTNSSSISTNATNLSDHEALTAEHIDWTQPGAGTIDPDNYVGGGAIGYGGLGARPASESVPAGTLYHDTDVDRLWVSDGVTADPVGWSIHSHNISHLDDISTDRILGRTTASTGPVEAMTGGDVTLLLDEFNGTQKGVVPNTSGNDGSICLLGDGSFGTPDVPLSQVTAGTMQDLVDAVPSSNGLFLSGRDNDLVSLPQLDADIDEADRLAVEDATGGVFDKKYIEASRVVGVQAKASGSDVAAGALFRTLNFTGGTPTQDGTDPRQLNVPLGSGGGGTGANAGTWSMEASTMATPVSGSLRTNSANFGTTTQIAFHEQPGAGGRYGISTGQKAFAEGAVLRVTDAGDSANFASYRIIKTLEIYGSAAIELQVQHLSSGGTGWTLTDDYDVSVVGGFVGNYFQHTQATGSATINSASEVNLTSITLLNVATHLLFEGTYLIFVDLDLSSAAGVGGDVGISIAHRDQAFTQTILGYSQINMPTVTSGDNPNRYHIGMHAIGSIDSDDAGFTLKGLRITGTGSATVHHIRWTFQRITK